MRQSRFRFTIHRLMGVVAIAAILLALSRNSVIANASIAIYLIFACMAWLLSRELPRLAFQGFLISAIWTNFGFAVVYVYLPYFRDPFFFLLLLPFIPFVVGFGASWASTRSGRLAKARAWLLVVVLAAVPVSMIATYWPLRLGFRGALPALNRLADRVAAGEWLAAPEWAGLYRVVAAKRESSSGDVKLLIDPNPGGVSGFVRRGSASPGRNGAMDGLTFEGIDGRWYFLDED